MVNRRTLALLFIATLLTVTLVVAAGMVGTLSLFVNLFVPLPVAVVTLRHGGWIGFCATTLAGVAVALIGEGAAWLFYLVQFGLPGLLLPLLLRRGLGWDRALLLALSATVATALAALAAFAGGGIVKQVEDFMAAEIDRAMTAYRSAELSKEQLEELSGLAVTMKQFLITAWPGLGVVIFGFFLLVLVYLLTTLPATRSAVPGPAFVSWKSPELLVWPLILGGFGLFVEGTVRTLALNLMLVLVPIYFLQGLAIVTYFFQQRGLPPLLRSLGYLMLVLLNPLPLVVAALGLFDLWADFRKPRITNN